jgi:hypothetical protein
LAPRLRGHIQDVAPPGREHRRQHRPVGEIGAAQVRVDDLVPLGAGELRDGAQGRSGGTQDARGMDQDVDAAVPFQRGRGHARHVALAADVERQHQGHLGAGLDDRGRGFRETARVAADQHRHRTGMGERDAGVAADAAARPGDDRDPTGQGAAGDHFASCSARKSTICLTCSSMT